MAKPAKKTANGRHIGLQGWDTASVLQVATLDKLIRSQNKSPPSFDVTNKFNGTMKGTWGPWSVTPAPGISGGNVAMTCPVRTGTLTLLNGVDVTLDGLVVHITVSLDAVPDPQSKLTDPTRKKTGSGKAEVQSLKADSTGTKAANPVTITKITPQTLSDPTLALFTDWLNANMAAFDAVFHTAVINEIADVGAFQWLKPTGSLSYASTTDGAGDEVFAALCMTDGRSSDDNAHQIDAGAASNFPDGANSCLVISNERFVEKFLKTGAQLTMDGSKDGDFDIVGDDLIVTNNKPLLWRKVTLQDGSVASPTVPTGGMTLEVDEDRMILSFTGLTFEHSLLVGSDVLSMTFKQITYLSLGKNAKGEPVLTATNRPAGTPPDKDVPTIDQFNITVTPDRTARNFDEWMAIVGVAASLIGVGAFAKAGWAVRAGQEAIAAQGVRDYLAGTEAVIDVAMDADAAMDAIDGAELAEGNLAAAAAFTQGALPMSSAAIMNLEKLGKVAMLCSGVAGVAYGAHKIAELVDSKGYIDMDKCPTMETFVANALGCHAWPQSKSWTLTHAELAGSLLLFGQLETE